MTARFAPPLALIASLFVFAQFAHAQTPPIRIMPLGDSITYGASTPGGYRYPLYVSLTNAGYNVDYVGSQTGNSDPGLGAEVNHEGHGGWRISNPTASNGLYEYLYSWFEIIDDPHLVLVHVGTNDTNDPDFQHAIDELDALVTRIAQCQPSAEIIVTTLMKRSPPNYTSITNYFNPYVYPLVTNHVAQGHHVHFLDMHAYLELSDMYDNLHPSAGGYQKMANAWFPAITNIIGTQVGANQPAPIRALGVTDNRQAVTISFNKAVAPDSATNIAHYAIDNGLSIAGATISANHRFVTLTTGLQDADAAYTITLNNIADETAPTALTIPADSRVTFASPATPAIVSATGSSNRLQVAVLFSKAVAPSTATNTANYALSGGLGVLSATISADHKTVTLNTDPQTAGTGYTVTVNNVTDETTPSALTIPPDSTASFTAEIPRGYGYYVPESTDYTLVYSLNLPTTADYASTVVPYTVDNSATVGPFSRVAYYLELQKSGGTLQYLWVSMDAFTNRADKLGVPTFASGAVYQQLVRNMNVFCNVDGVWTGTGLTTGNIEFWPYNYSTGNALGIPNANASTYDFGDQCSFSGNYASMQVHNHGASQTLFSVNHWNANSTLEIGIGNQPTGSTDWTFSNNAGTYTVKSLQVLVMCDPSADTEPPTPLTAQAGVTRRLITVTFDEMLAPSSVDGTRFSVDNGVEVLSAKVSPDRKSVYLTTTLQPAGIPLTLSVSGVRDLAANPVPAGTTLAVTQPAPPAEVLARAGSLADGYQLIYTLDIPVKGNFNASPDFYRVNQSGFIGPFDRIAYYVELQKADGTLQYLWASMDAFTNDVRRIGVPTAASGAVFQCPVSNLDVQSNVSGITNGVAMTGGNLEFWPTDYGAVNAMSVTNASDTNLDFGDERRTTGSHGSMQIHNAEAKQTLFGMSNWGADNNTLGLGIGNCPSPVNAGVDWTFAANAGTAYTRRLLHVLVRPAAAQLPEVAANVPEAQGYQLAYTVNLPVTGSFTNTALAPSYFLANNVSNNAIPASFSRIAYYLELQSGSASTQWVWTAMDAFTQDARKIAVPTNNCLYQQKVSHLQVRSNVGGIVAGDDLATGNIEFWPSDYNQVNAIGIPNANASTFDFGDGNASATAIGYGSMQVHNYGSGATQTLFAVNNFNRNSTLCVGIGNNPSGSPDWTHAYNAGAYTSRRLHVFVATGGESDTNAPTLTKASASRSLTQVALLFSEALADTAQTASFYTLNNGATVISAALQPDLRTVLLTTSPLTAGQAYLVTANGVRDRSSAGNAIAPGASASFTAPAVSNALPDVLTNVVETAQYQLIYQVAIGNTVNWASGCSYAIDESRFAQTQAFDRVAYCLELVTNGVYKWVYVSMDAFTPDLTKIGVPTVDRGAIWQQYVSNLNVYASDNVANSSVTTGTGIASGNIEFWPSNYGASNDKNVSGASGTTYDFGDGGSPNGTTAGHGSMQVHNYLQGHTIFSMCSFGSNGRQPCLGIGNNPVWTNNDPDWTFTYNAQQYTTKNLYVLARPGQPAASSGTAPLIWSQPRSSTIYLGESARMTVYSPDATAYQWRKNGAYLAGATKSWLEFDPAEADDSAVYDVIVTGPSGYTTSVSATLLVHPYTPPETPKPIRIMPLGDSITYGVGAAGGYRLPLYAALTNAGYSVDFVGTQTGNGATGLPDSDHEGHSGWTIGQLDANILDWLYAIDDPDVVLLHIGTNDSGASDFSNRVDYLDALVTKIATNRPSANIIVTTLMKRSDLTRYAAITNSFNPYVEGKVLAQRALGRKVHFLDMHAYLELTDMDDGLHPNAGGYLKMANAWLPVITNAVSVYGDASAPTLSRALATRTLDGVKAVFSKALDPATATNTANYALSGGAAISGASLSTDQRTVTLTTTPLTRNATYTLTVNDVKDYAWPVQRTVAANSSDSFRATIRGYTANVPEASSYRLVYALNLPNSAAYGATMVAYATNNADLVSQPLRRIAYYMELQTLNGDLTYLWASMDAFTGDVNLIGVPARITGAIHQKSVNNLTVLCNDPSVTSGTGLSGNIEFWPSNYTNVRTLGLPAASDTNYDADDTPTPGSYGSMQIHNSNAGQTLFAFNNWGSTGGATPDVGIGNCPAPKNGGLDWTFQSNAGNLPVRTLAILVQTGDDTTPPTLVAAQAGSAGSLVTVTFSERLTADSILTSCFALDRNVEVVTATLLPDGRTVNLTTSFQPVGELLTLTVTGVRDLGGGNAIADGSTIPVTPAALPPEVLANIGASADGYQLVYSLDVPASGTLNASADPYRYNQSLATGSYDRVAYYLELVKADTTTQYVWTAMDAFTPYRQQTGVPTAASKAVFQQYVSNLVVKSNVSGVSNGSFASGGNIEFWPSNYSQANALGIMNASASYYDFGDTRSTGSGFGSMQVHNAGVSQVLFALNHWGTDGNALDLGIGNRPGSNDKDWTNTGNAGTYYRRTLHVMVRPTPAALALDLPAEIAAHVPLDLAGGYQLVCSITNMPAKGTFDSATWASTNYVVDRRSLIVSGAYSRIAYYVELQTATDAVPRYVWTSMDAFTPDATKIGIPLSGTLFQQKVSRLDVFSNVPSISNGTGIATGNIEFWPGNYNQSNAIGIPGADSSQAAFDFGDGGASSTTGHGCMQVHNYGAKQTVWAINHFNLNNPIAMGIGNNPNPLSGGQYDPDYTFTYNAGTYTRSVFHVLVLPGGDNDRTAPTITRALASRGLTHVRVSFSEPLSGLSAQTGSFALNNGASVLGATLATNMTDIMLTTSPLTQSQSYQLTVNGVCDRSSNTNRIAANSTVNFTTPGTDLPAVLANVPEIGDYTLIHQLAIDNSVTYSPGGAPYSVDESLFPQDSDFDRIAYCLELTGTNGVAQWVYVSMDAFTHNLSQIGVPTANRGAFFQQYVSNMIVCASANVAGSTVVTGEVAVGNIEFWPYDYQEPNDFAIPGASATAFDFGDRRLSSGSYGSMQVHNTAARQTIFAMNHFGGSSYRPCLGIGNQPSGSPDWTFNENALSFSVKNLYVLIRPSATTTTGSTPVIVVNPADKHVYKGHAASFYVQALGASGYQWRRNGKWIPGATQSYLVIDPADLGDTASYDVLVFGSSTVTQSEPAELIVTPFGTLLQVQ